MLLTSWYWKQSHAPTLKYIAIAYPTSHITLSENILKEFLHLILHPLSDCLEPV